MQYESIVYYNILGHSIFRSALFVYIFHTTVLSRTLYSRAREEDLTKSRYCRTQRELYQQNSVITAHAEDLTKSRYCRTQRELYQQNSVILILIIGKTVITSLTKTRAGLQPFAVRKPIVIPPSSGGVSRRTVAKRHVGVTPPFGWCPSVSILVV
jgi:hypothetical protein